MDDIAKCNAVLLALIGRAEIQKEKVRQIVRH